MKQTSLSLEESITNELYWNLDNHYIFRQYIPRTAREYKQTGEKVYTF